MRLEERVRGEGKGTYARPPTPIRCFVPMYEHFCEEAAGQESRTPHAQRQSASTMPSICQQDPNNVMGGLTGEVVYHNCSDDPPLDIPVGLVTVWTQGHYKPRSIPECVKKGGRSSRLVDRQGGTTCMTIANINLNESHRINDLGWKEIEAALRSNANRSPLQMGRATALKSRAQRFPPPCLSWFQIVPLGNRYMEWGGVSRRLWASSTKFPFGGEGKSIRVSLEDRIWRFASSLGFPSANLGFPSVCKWKAETILQGHREMHQEWNHSLAQQWKMEVDMFCVEEREKLECLLGAQAYLGYTWALSQK
ncbi:hypothetical protein FA13DRAFT_1773639 [Coprinellus micaceus]|uniref:Uncharacterized protein n=1 Tax=Coprinellus micaceus TaxID=71717 RepID=A0A4Y7TH92_COPMI|nr:hypothetical protein FA13DRAFT_1773639 [Coprinellus micaceus]